MMNLQELRRRVCGLPDKNGATGPTWINPKEAIYLLDTIDFMQSRLESLEKDAARLDWMSGNYLCADFQYGEPATEVIVIEFPKKSRYCGDLRVDVDTAMQANKRV